MAEKSKQEVLHVRVSLARKSQKTAENLADGLRKMGFENVTAGARGVDFQGQKESIEDKLQAVIGENEHGNLFTVPPRFPDNVEDQVRSAYFPSKPDFFVKKRESE